MPTNEPPQARDYSAEARGEVTDLNIILSTLEFVWLLIFTLEMLLKIYALEFIGMDAYVTDVAPLESQWFSCE